MRTLLLKYAVPPKSQLTLLKIVITVIYYASNTGVNACCATGDCSFDRYGDGGPAKKLLIFH